MAYFKPTSHLAQAANRSYASEFKKEQTLHVSLQRSLFQRGSIMLALLLSVFFGVAGYSQVHYEDLDNDWGNNRIIPPGDLSYTYESSTSSGIGQFVVSKSGRGMRLLDNWGHYISQTDNIISENSYGEKNIAVATNHNSEVAIVTVGKTNDVFKKTLLRVRILGNDASEGNINMNRDRILEEDLPPYTGIWTFPNFVKDGHWENVDIWHLEAILNDKFLYITWKELGEEALCLQGNGISHYGFAAFDIVNNVFTIPPTKLLDPNGDLATGRSAPTSATNRWREDVDHAKVAFSYFDQRDFNDPNSEHAAVFVPNLTGFQPAATRLIEPQNGSNSQQCKWVRVVNYDEPDGASGFHFFYAYYYPIVNQPTINLCLFSTDATQVSGIINDRLPPAESENYAPPGVGNGYTEKAVYLLYKTEDTKRMNAQQAKPRDELDICMQWGNDNYTEVRGPRNEFAYMLGYNVLTYTLGCNQMGIHMTWSTDWDANFMNGGDIIIVPDAQIVIHQRARRPIAQHIRENVLVTMDNRIEHLQWHPIIKPPLAPEQQIWVLPSESISEKADTLRIRKDTPNEYRTTLYPTTLQFTDNAYLSAGVPSHLGVVEEASWDEGRRGYIILDGSLTPENQGSYPRIDFNNQQGAAIGAEFNGGIEYNGAYLLNMNENVLFAKGFVRKPDTLEKHRGLMYINAPCTIFGGSSLYSNKGQVTFKAATDPEDAALIQTFGQGTSIWMDTTMLYLGARNTTTPFGQILMWGNATTSTDQEIIIRNSVISSGWENLVLYDILPDGYRSDMLIMAPKKVEFTSNCIYTTFIDVRNPLGDVSFNGNEKIYQISKQLNVFWGPPADQGYPLYYPGDMQINYNTVKANFYDGNGSWTDEAKSFTVTGFFKLRPDDPFDMNDQAGYIEINGNTIWNHDITLSRPFQSNWTGITIDRATQAFVKDNFIANIATGIYQEGLSQSISYLCSNEIRFFMTGCIPDVGIGVRQKGGRSLVLSNELLRLGVGYLSELDEESNFINNYLESNSIGAKFTRDAHTFLNGGGIGVPGMNYFDNNYENGSRAQIQMHTSIGSGDTPQPKIGADVLSEDEENWGQNTFISTPGETVHIEHINDQNTATWFDLTNTLKLNEWSPALIESTTQIGQSGDTQDPMVVRVGHFNEKNVTSVTTDITCPEPYTGPATLTDGKGSHPLWSLTKTFLPQGEAEDSLYLYKRARANQLAGNYRNALDTVRLYVERHPFATKPPGEVLGSISNSIFYTGHVPNSSKNDYIINHNWLVKIYPNSTEPVYQAKVWRTMASNMENFDLNEAANLWYNYTLVYTDTGNVVLAWESIKSIRGYQAQIPMDTTPFHVISFPPDPIISGVSPVAHSSTPIEIAISPNPAKTETELSFSLEERSAIHIELFDMLGRSVKKVYSGMLDEGKHTYPVSIAGLAEGMYYVRLSANDAVTTKSIRVVK